MGAHNVFNQMGLALGAGANAPNRVPDPGDGGTLVLYPNCAYQICVCNSAGAETRVIPEPTDVPIGSVLLIIGDAVSSTGTDIDFETADSTQLTTTSSEDVMTLGTDGESFSLVVSSAAGVKQWRLRHNDGGTLS